MSNRKIQIMFFAAVAAFGIAITPATARPGDHHGSGSHKMKSSSSSHGSNHKWDKHTKHASHEKHHKWKHHVHHKWHHKWWHKKHYEAPVYSYSRPVYTAPTTYTYTNSRPAYASAPCTCLSKEYDEDGSVVFKDNCTKEMAVYSKED